MRANGLATRWVFMCIYGNQSEVSSVDFLNRLEHTTPPKIIKLLTDNRSQFTDRFTSKKREPTGLHKFDVRCKALNIAHRLCLLRHPQTNVMVERFNGRISEVVKQTRFASAAQLEATLANCVKTYNPLIPQRALNHVSPVQALKNWQAKMPELFVKRVYKQPGLDNYLLAVKENQGNLFEVVHAFFDEGQARGFGNTAVSCFETLEKDHGRIETWRYVWIDRLDWMEPSIPNRWKNLAGVGLVERQREIKGKISIERTLYIGSEGIAWAQALANAAQGHWGIENRLHWVFDVTFREDECRVRVGHAPRNFSLMRKFALTLLRQDQQNLKRSLRSR